MAGARQGISTAGLNHAMHEGVLLKERGWINQQLKNGGYSNEEIKKSLLDLNSSERKEKIFELMKNVKSLSVLRKKMFTVEVTMTDHSDGYAATTSINDWDNPEGSTSTVKFYNASFKSLYSLTRAFHNESIHIQHNWYGYTHKLYKSALAKLGNNNLAKYYAYQVSNYWSSISSRNTVNSQYEADYYQRLADTDKAYFENLCYKCYR